MAMIECPECGRRISDLADMCLGCGISQKTIERLLAEEADQKTDVGEEIQEQKDTTCQKQVKIAPISVMIKKEESGVIRSEVQRQGIIRCSICKNTYQSSEEKCPKCKYPVFTVCSNSEKLRRQMKEFRKEAGINELDLHVGQFYKMGFYRGEEISWKVLTVEDGKALLISEKGLDVKSYHGFFDYRECIYWENCALRQWLNGEFLNTAFTGDEKSRIVETKITVDKNYDFEIEPGPDTMDWIFLLSIQEAKKYYSDYESIRAYPTAYAKNKGAYVDDRTKCCRWWLRSPGFSNGEAAFVWGLGLIDESGSCIDDGSICVRPSCWVNLKSKNVTDNKTTRKNTGVTAGKKDSNTEKPIVKKVQNSTNSIMTPVTTISKNGEYYKMGYYGDEEILWRVLAVENGKALLISEKGLDAKSYHNQLDETTWENCTLRSWLNTEFMDKAFSKEEKSRIPKMKITADKNPQYITDSGNDTDDQVFLLSIQEVEKYFADDEDRKAYPTKYAKENGASVDNSTKCCHWWLRSPGCTRDSAAFVRYYGWVREHGDYVDHDNFCVRPALWVNL